MPTKASRARRWIKGGKAIPRWNSLGIFYVQLKADAWDKRQKVVLGLDPGAKFDGVTIVTRKEVLQTGMLELPKAIATKMNRRRRQRRFRRYRKCRRRVCRFSNRGRFGGWIAPSQRAKVEFRLKIISKLGRLYPITKAIVEDVRFDHYRKRWGKFFSTVEIGKKDLYNTLLEWFGKVILVDGVDTARLREEYRVTKSSNKSERSVNSHAIDALVISAKEVGLDVLRIHSFFVWKRHQYPRRQLHRSQHEKGGRRRREGGSMSLGGFRKGDIVIWRNRLARVGGYKDEGNSLHSFDVDNKRFTQKANPNECFRLFNQKIMVSTIPLKN